MDIFRRGTGEKATITVVYRNCMEQCQLLSDAKAIYEVDQRGWRSMD